MGIVKVIIEFVMDILETIVFIGSIFIVVYLFILQPNQVRGASMEPTFLSGDYILTSKITYKLRNPQRGDIVVFKSPRNKDIDYIKRIIGLPGDTVMVSSNNEVFVNGQLIQENYLSAPTNVWEGGFMKADEPITVPPDQVFVMGDNRPRSSDSREFGTISINDVIGYVFYRYLPTDKMGVMENPWPSALRSFISNKLLEYSS